MFMWITSDVLTDILRTEVQICDYTRERPYVGGRMSFINEQIRLAVKTGILDQFGKVFSHNENFANGLNLRQKDDRTLVTDLDVHISHLVKSILFQDPVFKSYSFVSEEDVAHLDFPSIVLDPIDGTIELSQGIPECALSLATFKDASLNNEGWIFNPFTGFEMGTHSAFQKPSGRFPGVLSGFVSRSEWNQGLFKNDISQEIRLSPRGSIAYKLALLAAGACDFVVSKKPKHLWDIAAGTLICHRHGIALFENSHRVERFDRMDFQSPLLWCRPEDTDRLMKAISF